MFGVSYNNLWRHICLNLLASIGAFLLVGSNGKSALFYVLILVIAHCFITDLMPHRSHGWQRIVHIFWEEFLPTVVPFFVLVILSKDLILWPNMIISLFVAFAISLFLKGIFSVISCWLHLNIAQLITGFIGLVLLGGIFILPSLLFLLENYETKNHLYLLFAQVNPLIVLCNLFDLDPFHKDQLYQYFGSNFLVPKMDGLHSLVIWGIFAAIFWMVYGFWCKEKENSTQEEL